jgi:hypothetical protein
MSTSERRTLSVIAASAALAVTSLAIAADLPTAGPLNLTPSFNAPETAESSVQPTTAAQYMQAAAPEAPNVHGFAAAPVKTAYVTPRGLVVEDRCVVIQPIVGLVFPTGDVGPFKDTAIVTGIWNNFTTAQDDEFVDAWNEVDYFVSLSGKVGDFTIGLTYSPWFFPQSTTVKPKTEHNIDLKISYADKWFDEWTINPYVQFWWAVAGSSTVVLGDTGQTGYVEFGVVPTKVWQASADFPVTFTFPTYFSVGPEGYWDATGAFDGGNFGVFSTSVNASMPIPFIPTRYGHWHFDVGVSYFYIINDALLEAGNILSGNDDENVFVGSVGVGVNF